jgi:hypothetical protein
MLVGRRQIRALSKADKTVGTLRCMEGRGHTKPYQTAFGARAKTERGASAVKICGGIIGGMAWRGNMDYLWKTVAWLGLVSPVSPASFPAGNFRNDDEN